VANLKKTKGCFFWHEVGANQALIDILSELLQQVFFVYFIVDVAVLAV